MKLTEKIVGVRNLKKVFSIGEVIRFTAGISLALALAGTAFAQYGGGGGMGTGTTGTGSTGYGSPSYGSGKAIGIGVGVAAAGAGALYLALHHAGSVTGCVQSGDDGLTLVDDKKKSYRLMSGGLDLVPGERVELRGKKSQAGATGQSFQPKKLVKNLGSCGTPSASTKGSFPSATAMSAHNSPQQ